MKSKENYVLELFFNSSRHWQFGELMEKAGISRRQLLNWLNKFEKDGLIRKVKEPGRHPYYVHNFPDPRFLNRKKLYALKNLTESGLLDHLVNLQDAKVVILFGSFSRADWYEHSDIDVFIYGKDVEFEQGRFEKILKREIQVFNARNKKELKHLDKMLPAIISGDFIKGNFHDLGVDVYAKA
jgi:predicted nucleotidyltransferase